MGMFDLIGEKCRTKILHCNMNRSRIMMYAHQMEKSKLKRNNREAKRVRSDV